MKDLDNRFKEVMNDTVKEWKSHSSVIGIFVYGSYVRGTITANSDLDIAIVWKEDEAPVSLLSSHKEVRVDMVFMTVSEIEAVLEGTTTDVLKISEVINRLRTSKVLHDKGHMLENWRKRAQQYVWAAPVIEDVREKAFDLLSTAKEYVTNGDNESAIYTLREGLFYVGRVIVMRNNIFTMLKPAEILTEIRMLDPITYQLFLRTFKLKGLDEPKLLPILGEIKEWMDKAEQLLEESKIENIAIKVTGLLAQTQREYHGAMGLTYGGDYELAVLEMRQATCTLGRAISALRGGTDQDCEFIKNLQEYNDDFFNQILVEYGAYDIQPGEINRIISEVQFIAHRI